MSFWQVYRIIIKRKWVVLACCLLTMIVVGVGTLFLPRHYAAKAILLPSERALRRSTNAAELPQPTIGERESQQANLIALARTTAVASRALKALNSSLTPWQLLGFTTVRPLQQDSAKAGVDLIEISCRAKDPAFAVAATNAMARSFVDTYDEVTHRDVLRTIDSLTKQAEKEKADMDKAASRLAEWRRKTRITSLPEQVQAALSEITPARTAYDETLAQLAKVDGNISGLKTQLVNVKPTKVVVEGTTFSPEDSPTYKQLTAAEQQFAELSLKYKPAHPKMVSLTTMIEGLRAKLKNEQEQVHYQKKVVPNPIYNTLHDELVSSIVERKALAAKADTEAQQVAAKTRMLSAYSGVDIDLDSYIRQYKSSEESYNSVMAKLHQVRVAQNMTGELGTIELIDEARVAEGPIRKGPNNFQLVVAAAILGLALGVGFVVMADLLDDTIRTPDDAQELLSLPVAGIVPSMSAGGVFLPARVTEQLPLSSYAEAYRFLAMDLLCRDPRSRPQVIMVATPKPGQGGTTTTCNLAISLAQAGNRVVLIDADMRRPSLHRLFDLSNEKGLGSVLQGDATVEEVCQPVGSGNLHVITAGPPADNPWMLLRSEQMRRVIATLRASASFVIIDTPSAMVFADALALSELVDGTVVVLRSHESLSGGEMQLKEVLNRANVPIIGIVLNDVDPRNVSSHQYHSHYYAQTVDVTEVLEQPSSGSTPVLEANIKDESRGTGPTEV